MMTTESRINALVHWGRISQFVSVGVVGATIETIIMTILTGFLGVGPLAAKAIGAETSISAMFTINDRWTFAEEGNIGAIAFVRRWMKSHLVRAIGLSVAFVVLYLLTSIVTVSAPIVGIDLWPTIANIIGIGVGMVINYVAESLFTWQVT